MTLQYEVYGLRVSSELECPELRQGDGQPPDVSVSIGAVPASLPNPSRTRPAYDVTSDQTLLRILDVGRFLITSGRTIAIEPAPRVNAEKMRQYLLGSAMGALLHQRGFLPIHGSAILGPTGATIICGRRGYGKSTTAAALGQRGYPVICDDVSALRVEGEDLVVFRDKQGRPGLLHNRCCHRGTTLYYGRVEEEGLRCCYHGWLFNVDGTILETPGETPDSKLKDDLFHGAYPAIDLHGMVWAYMGPPELIPDKPHLDFFDMHASAQNLGHIQLQMTGFRRSARVQYTSESKNNQPKIDESFFPP